MAPYSSEPTPIHMIVFGGNGDLALRKLLPALFYLEKEHRLAEPSQILGASRHHFSQDEYIQLVHGSLQSYVPACDFDQETWERFARRLNHVSVDGTDPSSFTSLKAVLDERADLPRIFYFSTPPSLFAPLADNLHRNGLVETTSRVVLEKPLGHDQATSRAINESIARFFSEEQTYRIDHYLGKETVQNLLVLRFANALFEPLWNRSYVDHVQITVAETIGVEGRWGYYDHAGAMRDMVQNHLLQLLCLVAMEPPAGMDQDAVRNEKVKVLTALRPMDRDQVLANTVRGQYRDGAVNGVLAPGYHQEEGANKKSRTETFVALRAMIDNWRWADVPFFLRTGKRLPKRLSEIVVQFRALPHLIFPDAEQVVKANRLVIRIQPDEGVKLMMMNKTPGPGPMAAKLTQVPLNLSFADTFRSRHQDAYERLLFDVTRGNPTLFMRRDEVDAAWQWVDAIIDGWQSDTNPPKGYAAGTWGPSASVALIEREDRHWHEDLDDGEIG